MFNGQHPADAKLLRSKQSFCHRCTPSAIDAQPVLSMQAARQAVTTLEPSFSEAQAHLQESLEIQSNVILQVAQLYCLSAHLPVHAQHKLLRL